MSDESIESLKKSIEQLSIEEVVEFSIEKKAVKIDSNEDADTYVINPLKKKIEGKDSKSFKLKLILNGISLGTDAAKYTAEELGKLGLQIIVADFSDIFTGRKLSEVSPAVESLSELVLGDDNKNNLEEIDFSHNAFGPAGATAFTKHLKENKKLKVLKLTNDGLGPEGGKIIAKCLESNSELPLITFESGRGRLENEGAKALSKAFEKMETLTALEVPQNGIKVEGITALCKSLENKKNLRVLNFNDNAVLPEGVDAIVQLIEKAGKNLEVLNLGDCMIENEGVQKVIEALSENTTLKELNLNFNEMDDETTCSLAECLKNKKELEKLEINGNEIKKNGLKAIQDALKELNKEDVLGSLSDNEGDDSDDEEEEENDDE